MYTNIIFFLQIRSIFPIPLKLHLLADKGFAPTPLTEMSAKKVIFLDGSPYSK